MHPLSPDLTQLTDAELQKKHAELLSRLTQSYKFGNAQMVHQLQMLLDDYNLELNRRQRKIIEDLAGKDNKFSGIIDIK